MIHARPTELLARMEQDSLRDRVKVLEEALRYYAKPRTYGSGPHAIFIDDSGIAKEALRGAARLTIDSTVLLAHKDAGTTLGQRLAEAYEYTTGAGARFRVDQSA